MAQAAGQMGLASVRRAGRRAFEQVLAGKHSSREHASTPSVPWTYSTRNLSQLHRELRGTVPDLSERWFSISEGASSIRGELQLPAVPAWTITLRRSNEKTRDITVLFLLLDGNFLCRRNQEHQHHDFRDGLRSLCTRRARVIESCIRSGHSRR